MTCSTPLSWVANDQHGFITAAQLDELGYPPLDPVAAHADRRSVASRPARHVLRGGRTPDRRSPRTRGPPVRRRGRRPHRRQSGCAAGAVKYLPADPELAPQFTSLIPVDPPPQVRRLRRSSSALSGSRQTHTIRRCTCAHLSIGVWWTPPGESPTGGGRGLHARGDSARDGRRSTQRNENCGTPSDAARHCSATTLDEARAGVRSVPEAELRHHALRGRICRLLWWNPGSVGRQAVSSSPCPTAWSKSRWPSSRWSHAEHHRRRGLWTHTLERSTRLRSAPDFWCRTSSRH